jgi:murein DD-endopeptidase MepM/ murein hydrolase activator NlpD
MRRIWVYATATMIVIFGAAACNAKDLHLSTGIQDQNAASTQLSTQKPIIAATLADLQPSTPNANAAQAVTPTAVPDCGPDWCVYSGHFVFQRPVDGFYGDDIDDTYRYNTTQGGAREPHSGVEFQGEEGDAVKAAGDGTVVVAGNNQGTPYAGLGSIYGNLIIIQHQLAGVEQPIFTLYGHLSEVDVTLGEAVNAGQKIGKIGDTGAATGPHLHFEVREGTSSLQNTRNPELWLMPHAASDGQLNGAIAGKILDPDGSERTTDNLVLKSIPSGEGATAHAVYLETYATDSLPSDDNWGEQFAAGDLPAGMYQISLIADGVLIEDQVQVKPGSLTFVALRLKQ